jgi:Ni/Fe-hydrogenase subunit HybB-like protein
MLQSYVIYLKYQTNNMIFSSEFWMIMFALWVVCLRTSPTCLLGRPYKKHVEKFGRVGKNV